MSPLNLTDLRPDRTIDPAGLEAAHDLLHARIAGTAPSTVTDVASRRRRGAARLGLLGAAAAAVAAVALALPNPTDSAAFAGWTAVPANLDAADTEAAGAQCLAQRTGLDVPEESRPDNLADAKAVLADRRGETTFTVLASDAGLQSCLIGPHISTSSVLTGEGVSTTVDLSSSSPTAPAQLGAAVGRDDAQPEADAATYASGGINGVGSDAPWGFAVGRVGADVVSVEVILGDETSVTASVADGVWAAWWPQAVLVADVVPTLADGTTGTSPEITDAIEVVLGPGWDADEQGAELESIETDED